MFEAFSESKNAIVNIHNEYNLNELFECPNPNCEAKFKIKSANGKKAKHFARLKSTPHIFGCPYNISSAINAQDENLLKNPIEDIFNDSFVPSTKMKNQSNSINVGNRNTTFKHVRTPRQLLSLCINSDLNDEYLDGIKIGDIILDNRNLLTNANFKGISGLRFVLAETVKFERPNMLLLRLWTKTKNNKTPTLNINVFMYPGLLDNLINYVLSTYNNVFVGHSIAVFGDWMNDKPYNISCHVTDKKHIIFKF